MKIRKVKWANHPILGNLELSFVNPATNHPFSTIIFAGGNFKANDTKQLGECSFLGKKKAGSVK